MINKIIELNKQILLIHKQKETIIKTPRLKEQPVDNKSGRV